MAASPDAQVQQLLETIRGVEAETRATRKRLGTLRVAAQAQTLNADPARGGAGARRAVPAVWLKELMEERDGLVVVRKEARELGKEKQRLAASLDKVLEARRELQDEKAHLEEATGCAGPNARHARHATDLRNEGLAAKRELRKLVDERTTVRNDMELQNAKVARLVTELSTLADVEHDLAFRERELEVRRLEIRMVDEEIKSFEHIFRHKGKMLDREWRRDDTPELLALEMDKRCGQAELQKQQGQLAQSQLSALQRAMQLKKAQERSDLLAEALKAVLLDRGMMDPATADDAVDSEELDAVRREINTFAREEAGCEEQLSFLDAQVENAENRVRILHQAMSSNAREQEKATESYNARVQRIDKELGDQIDRADAEIDAQHATAEARRQRIAALESKLNRAQPQ